MQKVFRTIGLLEAVSCFVLLGIAMPLKYYGGFTAATKIPGLIHGLLFLLYLFMANATASEEKWPKKKLILAYVAGFIPFGTLVFDRKYLNESAVQETT